MIYSSLTAEKLREILNTFESMLINSLPDDIFVYWNEFPILQDWMAGNELFLNNIKIVITPEQLTRLFTRLITDNKCPQITRSVWFSNSFLQDWLSRSSLGSPISATEITIFFENALKNNLRFFSAFLWKHLPFLEKWCKSKRTANEQDLTPILGEKIMTFFHLALDNDDLLAYSLWKNNPNLQKQIPSLTDDEYADLSLKVTKLGCEAFNESFISIKRKPANSKKRAHGGADTATPSLKKICLPENLSTLLAQQGLFSLPQIPSSKLLDLFLEASNGEESSNQESSNQESSNQESSNQESSDTEPLLLDDNIDFGFPHNLDSPRTAPFDYWP